MALVIPPGFAQIAYRFALAGDAEEMISTVGIDLDGITGLPAGAATAAMDAFVLGYPAAAWSTDWTVRGCTAYIGQDGGPPAIVEHLTDVVGVTAMDTPPQNCAVLIRKQTALGGRPGRGRMFLPPFACDEGNVAPNGMLDPDFRSDTQDNIDAWMGALSPVLLHDSLTPGSPAPTPITSFVVDTRIATQRRRLR